MYFKKKIMHIPIYPAAPAKVSQYLDRDLNWADPSLVSLPKSCQGTYAGDICRPASWWTQKKAKAS